MGKIQEAMRKAEEARSKDGGVASGPSPAAAGIHAGTATSFAISAALSGGEVDPHLVALTEPGSPLAGEYRALAAALLAAPAAQPLKVFVVTSAVPNEGKSVTSVNLAATLAIESQRRVVVIDADMRKPAIHKLLGIDNQRGLADYLGGGTMLEMVVQRSRLTNLWAIPAGRIPANSTELIGGKRMDDLLSRLRRDYDFVVMDTPPVVSNPDAAALAPRADGTLLVVRIDRTPREVARHAVELLKKARATVVGSVVTGVEGVPAA